MAGQGRGGYGAVQGACCCEHNCLTNSLQGGSQSWKIGRYRQNALWGMSTVHVDLGYLLYILRMHSLLVDFSLVIWYVCFHFHLRSYTQKYAFLYIRTQTELPKAD